MFNRGTPLFLFKKNTLRNESPVWLEGKKAFSNGLTINENPYDAGNDHSVEWVRGWLFAHDKRLAYFKKEMEREEWENKEPFDRFIERLLPKPLRKYSAKILIFLIIMAFLGLLGKNIGFKNLFRLPIVLLIEILNYFVEFLE